MTIFVLGGLAVVLVTALRVWLAKRRALARNLVHEIAEFLDKIDGEGSCVVRQAADASNVPPQNAYPSALLGSRLARTVEDFRALARDFSGAKELASEAQRLRVEALGETTLRALRDILSGRRHDIITRA